MKKTEIINSLKIIAFGLILSFGFSFVMAGSWAPPSGTPSALTNEIGPLNVGSASQTKTGPLVLNNILNVDGALTANNNLNVGGISQLTGPLIALGGTSTTVFNATGNALFNQNVNIDANLNVNQDTQLKQNTTVGNNLVLNSFDKTIDSRDMTGQRALCVNDNGKVILCSEASCGILHSSYVSVPPAGSGLCAANNNLVGSVTTSVTYPEYRWSCTNGPTTSSCFAGIPAACGSASVPNGTTTNPISYFINNQTICASGSSLTQNTYPSLSTAGQYTWSCQKGTSISAMCSLWHAILTVAVDKKTELGCVPTYVGSSGTLNSAGYIFRTTINATNAISGVQVNWVITDTDKNKEMYNFITYTSAQSANSSVAITPTIYLQASDSFNPLNKKDFNVTAIVKYGKSNWKSAAINFETPFCTNPQQY